MSSSEIKNVNVSVMSSCYAIKGQKQVFSSGQMFVKCFVKIMQLV
jgi:hypothetical protein